MSEEKTDNILDDVEEEVQEIDPREDPNKKNDKPTLDETVQKLIGKAGNHMESTLVGKTSSGLALSSLKLLPILQLLTSVWSSDI